MNFENLKSGDLIKIKNQVYEVLYSQIEADIALPPEYKIRTFLAIYLHKKDSNSLQPTHQLWYYKDTKEIFLVNAGKKKIDLEEIEQ